MYLPNHKKRITQDPESLPSLTSLTRMTRCEETSLNSLSLSVTGEPGRTQSSSVAFPRTLLSFLKPAENSPVMFSLERRK